MIPISAALVAVLFLGEAFTWMHAIGMSLVLGSIVVGTMRTGKKGATLET
jgi:drug/metabolite transporter (DMT)-like permease